MQRNATLSFVGHATIKKIRENTHGLSRPQNRSGNRRAGARGRCAQPRRLRRRLGRNRSFRSATTTIPIVGETDVFAVRRIYCIGRNYAAHAREMGSDPSREPPFFFQKPTDAIQNVTIGAVADHPYPSLTKNYHYEVELVAALKSGGTNIAVEQALDQVYGYAVGLDMTRRDLQRAMGDEKKPGKSARALIAPPCSARSIPPPRPAFHQGRDLAGA
jgi:2-keto-4-pentenoate hydratase/2-oxohepta-3-ene-1,7-dioic acid hydratase in catechol pathway